MQFVDSRRIDKFDKYAAWLVRLFAAVSLFLYVPSGSASVGEEISAEELLTLWEQGVSLVSSYDVWIVYSCFSTYHYDQKLGKFVEHGPAEPPIRSVYYSHVIRSGAKRFGEFQNGGNFEDLEHPDAKFKKETNKFVNFDGAIAASTQGSRKAFTISDNVLIFSGVQQEDYEVCYRTRMGAFDRIPISREREVKVLDREGGLYVIDVQPATGKSVNFANHGWKVWLDPNRNFMPARIYEYVDITGFGVVGNVERSNVLSEVSPGIWAVTASHVVIYSKNPGEPSFGKPGDWAELVVDLKKSRFMCDIPETTFKVDIPEGAYVQDRIRGISYTQGSIDPDHFLSHLAEVAKRVKAYSVSVPGKSGVSHRHIIIADESTPWWKRLLYIVVPACLTAFALGYFWKRRTRERSVSP